MTDLFSDKIKISVILPTYCEDDIPVRLKELFTYFDEKPQFQLQTIIVDDSPAEGFDKLKSSLKSFSNQNIELIPGDHHGKGAAVQKAAERIQGEMVFYMDADLRIPLEYVETFVGQLQKNDLDVVIAERPSGRNWRQPFRMVLSFALLYLQRWLVFNSHYFFDTQCGFKAFKKNIFKELARVQVIQGGMFDIEYLYIARLNRLKMTKVRVRILPESRPSKIQLLKCFFFDPLDLFKIKLNGLAGRYRLTKKS